MGHYLSLESHGENLINKQPDISDNIKTGMDGSPSAQTRKSQYEPLDLSIRPESVVSPSVMSPATLVQMSAMLSNGLSSSFTSRLQSYSNPAAELSTKSAYECDLLVRGAKEEMSTQNAASTGHDDKCGKSEKMREDENEDVAKWKMLKDKAPEPEELVQADFQDSGEKKPNKLGPWSRAVAESPISSLENLTPGQAEQQQPGSLLSFLRSQGNMSVTPASALKASVNGVGGMEKDVTSGEHQIKYHECYIQQSLL